MRLIDADALIDAVKQAQRSGKYSETTILAADIFIEFLNGQPTAFDVEAVVAELEEILDEFYSMEVHDQENPYNEGVQKGYKCALEIVRKGGKE